MSIAKSIFLTTEQKKYFSENGFIKLQQSISPLLLDQLRIAVDNLCAIGDQLEDCTILESSNKQKFVVSLNKIVSKIEPIFAQLLGSPLLLSLAESICGEDFFPVQDFLVIKTLGDENEVKWHQDVLTNCPEKTIMIGFYLDPADDKNGALRVIPKSHFSDLSICELQKMEYQTIDMQAGDILIHNLKIAHSSGELSTLLQRRVVYFEFLSSVEVIKEQLYSESFVQLRTSLIPNVIDCFTKAYPNENPFLWKHPNKERYSVGEDPLLAIQEVYEVPIHARAANYCFDFIGG
jgi:hypothetical protein